MIRTNQKYCLNNDFNLKSYGNALKVSRSYLRLGFIIICIVTPATNWLIPFVKKVITKDLFVRYNEVKE